MRTHRLPLAIAAMLAPAAPAFPDVPQHAKEIVVMVSGTLVTGSRITGAGIVFAATGSHVYVATARHVIERSMSAQPEEIWVEFYARRGVRAPARQADVRFGRDTDLAVLLVDADAAPPLKLTDRPRIRLARRIVAGDKVFLVGQPRGKAWAASSTGEPVTAVRTTGISVESGSVTGGMSGGGAFDAAGLLVGMVTHDVPPAAELLPVSYLAELLSARLPFDLRDAAAPSPTARLEGGRLALVAGRLPVRREPQALSAPFHWLHQGDRVMVLEEAETGWYRIRMPDNREGFVQRSADLRIRERWGTQ